MPIGNFFNIMLKLLKIIDKPIIKPYTNKVSSDPINIRVAPPSQRWTVAVD